MLQELKMKSLKGHAASIIIALALAAGLLFALRAELPDTFVLEQGQPLAVESMPFLRAERAIRGGGGIPDL